MEIQFFSHPPHSLTTILSTLFGTVFSTVCGTVCGTLFNTLLRTIFQSDPWTIFGTLSRTRRE